MGARQIWFSRHSPSHYSGGLMQQWQGSSSVQSHGSHVQCGFKHSSLLQSIPIWILLIAKLLLYIYHSDICHTPSFDLKIYLSKPVHPASKEHHNEIHCHNFYNKIYSLALAGPHPNNRTDQYAEYFLNPQTAGSAECIPSRKILSDNALALFHFFLSIPSEW